jgi:hypothetical protein
MMWIHLLVSVSLLYWILFMGGADRLEGSWLTAFLFVPGMTATEIRVWATLGIISLFVIGIVTGVSR